MKRRMGAKGKKGWPDRAEVGASIDPSPKRLLRDSLFLTSGSEGCGKPDYLDYRIN